MSKAKKELISRLQKENIKKEIINAFEKIDQKAFFDPIFKKNFYSDEPIPIGHGEKNEDPITLARMIDYLSPDKNHRVLEIGTGSGYSTAILSTLSRDVVTVEDHEDMALSAKERLENLNIDNVKFFAGDAAEFQSNSIMFDAIIIFAACSKRPLSLTQLLKKHGLMVFPMGPIYQQQITVLKNEPGKESEEFGNITFHEFCKFSPLKGMYE